MKNPKILVLDDSLIVRVLLQKILQSNGFEIALAENGKVALDNYSENLDEFELIVSDMDMPEMDGLNFLKTIRKNGHDIPLIILTANEQISIALEALQSGANDYLIKNDNLKETIMVSVKRILEKKCLEQENKKLMADLAEKNSQLTNFANTLENTINKLTNVGILISSEKNLNKLLKTILYEARGITNADGGTLYLLKNNQLHFKIIQNNTLDISMDGIPGGEIPFSPLPLDQSNIASVCALKNEFINIPNIYKTNEFDFSNLKKFDIKNNYKTLSLLTLPIMDRDNKNIGVLQLINSIHEKSGEIIPFTQDQINIIRSLASQASISIENSRSYEMLEKQNRNLEALQDISKALGSEIELDKLLSLIETKTTEVMEAELSSLFIYDETKKELRGKMLQDGILNEVGFSLNTGLEGKVARSKKLLNIKKEEYEQDSHDLSDKGNSAGPKPVLYAPIISNQGKLYGVNKVIRKGDVSNFNADNESLLKGIISLIAIALERANLVNAIVEKEKIEETLRLASEIQMNMLSKDFITFNDHKHIDLYAYLTPAKEVGGEIFTIFSSWTKTISWFPSVTSQARV